MNRSSDGDGYGYEHGESDVLGCTEHWTRTDERIREEVCECLTEHPHIDASELDVTVEDGEVTLTGWVVDWRMKRFAQDAVDDIRGVRDVHDEIRAEPDQRSFHEADMEPGPQVT